MFNIIRYSGVNARVKALLGGMLEEEDYQQLLNADSVQEIFAYLNENTSYQGYLKGLRGREVHRRQLEHILKKNLINDYQAIIPYLTGVTKKFFKYFFVKFEIEELKMLLRTVLVEHNQEYLKEELVYLGVRYGITRDKLTQVDDYGDLLNVFTDTPFYNTLQRFEERYKENKNLFPIEMTLDFQYFTRLGKLTRRLNKVDYRIIKDLLGTKMDLLNISFIYRIKRFYDLKFEEILNYILPYHYRLDDEELKQMVNLEAAEDVFDFLTRTDYDELFSSVKKDKGILFEKYFLSYLLRKALHTKVVGDFNIGVISGYLFIKEYEIRDIITIVEGVRYQLDKEEIYKYLIRDWV